MDMNIVPSSSSYNLYWSRPPSQPRDLIVIRYLTVQHFRHYTKPEYQRHIVRILCMVPVYSISAW